MVRWSRHGFRRRGKACCSNANPHTNRFARQKSSSLTTYFGHQNMWNTPRNHRRLRNVQVKFTTSSCIMSLKISNNGSLTFYLHNHLFFKNYLAVWKWYHILISECLKEISAFVSQVKFTLIIPRVAPVWPWAFYSPFIRKTWNGNLTSKPRLSSGQFLCHSFSFLFISMQGWVWFHLVHELVPHITRTKRHCVQSLWHLPVSLIF